MHNKELLEYRARLLEQVETSTEEFCQACRVVANPLHPIEEGWNLHQVTAHVRDVNDQVYALRVKRILAEDTPIFENFDPDKWALEQYDPKEALDAILDSIEDGSKSLVSILRDLPENAWSRMGRHEIYGDLTLQHWVERSLAHVKEHLETVRKA